MDSNTNVATTTLAASVVAIAALIYSSNRDGRGRKKVGEIKKRPLDRAEVEICRRRGHDAGLVSADKWSQCKWCGLWVRKKEILEEREDDPPKDEMNPLSGHLL